MNNINHNNKENDPGVLHCPFCDSTKLALKRIFFSELNRKKYEHYSCFACGIEFFTPLVFENVYDNEKIAAYKEFHKGRNSYPEWTKAFLKALKEKNLVLTGKKILEIGMGDGINFLALKENFNINPEDFFGVELDKKSIEVCKKREIINILEDFFGSQILNKIKKKFDIIIIAEVLEHQIDPKDFVKTVFKLLNRKGIIIITVPNKKRFFLKYREYGDIPPHHFLRFDKSFFRNNFKKGLIYLKDYTFGNKNMKDSSKALSVAILGSEKRAMFFLPLVLILRILDSIRGEGIIAIIEKRD